MAPILMSGLNEMGMQKYMPRVVVYGPLKYQGLDILNLHTHIQLSKFIHKWSPTLKHLSKFDNLINNHCFACGHLSENTAHIYQCTSAQHMEAQTKALTKFKLHLSKYHTRAPLADILINTMKKWLAQCHPQQIHIAQLKENNPTQGHLHGLINTAIQHQQ
jgi:hypothetical protein